MRRKPLVAPVAHVRGYLSLLEAVSLSLFKRLSKYERRTAPLISSDSPKLDLTKGAVCL